jgi:hypothetical protein
MILLRLTLLYVCKTHYQTAVAALLFMISGIKKEAEKYFYLLPFAFCRLPSTLPCP